MQSAEAESLFTPTGPDTSAAELSLRHWHPIAVVGELTDDQPVKSVRLLDQSLVLFRTGEGKVGLIQERCPHGGYPLAWGYIAEGSLVCGRHGWNFDAEGNCFIVGYQSKIYPMAWAQARTFPVEIHAGLYWAYLGPLPAPAPMSEMLAQEIERVLQTPESTEEMRDPDELVTDPERV